MGAFQDWIDELRRRRVVRVMIAYAAVAWLIVEFAELAFPRLQLPDWTVTLVLVLGLLGLPVVFVLAWAFDVTPEGVKRTGAGGPATGDETAAPRRVSMRGGLAIAALVVTAVVTSVIIRSSAGTDEDALPLDPNAIAVLPFQVTSADTTLAYLREGMVTLLDTRLTVEGDVRVVSPGTVLRAWSRAVGDESQDLAESDALELARSVGAGRLLLGRMVGAPSGLTATVRLLQVPDGAVLGEDEVAGSAADPTALADRIAARLLGLQGQESDERIDALAGRSIEVVKDYLRGQSAYRRGLPLEAIDYFDATIRADSTFGLGVLGLMIAGVSAGNAASDAWPRATPMLARLADQLPARDRLHAEALLGNRRASETLRRLQRAVEAAPEDVELLNSLGRSWIERGRYIDEPSWEQRAHAALDRAIRLDPINLDALSNKVLLALLAGDPDALAVAQGRLDEAKAAARGAGVEVPISPLRWIVPLATGDSAALEAVRPELDSLPYALVWPMQHWAAMLGLPTDDLERMIEGLERHAVSGRDLELAASLRYRLDLMVGRMQSVLQYARNDAPNILGTTPVNLLLYYHANPGLDEGLATLETRSDPFEASYQELCHWETWHVMRGDTTRTRAAISALKDKPAARRILGDCPVLLEAILAVGGVMPAADENRDLGARPVPASLMRADSLSRLGAEFSTYNLLLALAWERVGQIDRALAVIRRRPRWLNGSSTLLEPRYHREEGRLAALAGDVPGAIVAYQRFLALRTDPDPGLVADEVELVRSELAKLLPDAVGTN